MKRTIHARKVVYLIVTLFFLCFNTGMLAKTYTSSKTATIKGIAPYFNKVGAVGVLKEGETLEILTKGNNAQYQFIDGDVDEDNSLSTISWFLVEGNNIVQGSEKTGEKYTIPKDGSAVDKKVGFRITPLTKIGDPDRSREITVLDVSKLGGQTEDGQPGGDNDKPNDSIDNPDGMIRPGANVDYEISILDKDGTNIIADNINPRVKSTYTVKIVRKDTGQDYTTRFQPSIQWSMVEQPASGEPIITPIPDSKGQTQFTTQTTNSDARAKHPLNQSEQGLSIMVSFDDGNAEILQDTEQESTQ